MILIDIIVLNLSCSNTDLKDATDRFHLPIYTTSVVIRDSIGQENDESLHDHPLYINRT